MYSTTQNSSGAYDVFQNGAKVATGSSDILGNYGLSVPGSSASKVDNPTPTASPVTSLSTQQGAAVVDQANKTLSNLTPTAQNVYDNATKTANTAANTIGGSYNTDKGFVPNSSQSTIAAPAKVTLVNPTTGQSSTFDDASINKDSIQALLGNGYSVSDTSGGSLPSWLTAGVTGTTDTSSTPQGQAQQAITDASNELQTLTNNLSKYTVSDAQLQGQITSITNLWDSRIAAMNTVNNSRLGNIDTTGIRLGSQYAGGNGGTFGGIITEEERQGVARIADLEGQKQSAISAAQTAAATQNWTVYSKQVDLAEKAYQDKVTALKDLQTQTAAQNKVIADAIQKAKDDQYTQVTKPIQDIASEAAKNGADPKTIAAINGATDVQGAIAAAGGSLQTGTGQMGDYLQYKKDSLASGVTPTDYTTWKAADDASQSKLKIAEAYGTAFATAKGKAAAEAASAGPVATSPVTSPAGVAYNVPATIAPYVDFASNGVKYVDLSGFAGTPTEKNAAVNTAQQAGYRVITNKNTAADVQNISNALANLDSIQAAFDANNAGDVIQRNTYGAALSKLNKFLQTNPDSAAIDTFQDSGLDILKAISGIQGFRGGSSVIQQVKDTLPQITDTKAVVDQKVANIKNLITNRESVLVGQPSASDALLLKAKQDESSLTTNLQSIKTTNPSVFTAASNMYTSVNPDTGQPYTAADILQAFPELISK